MPAKCKFRQSGRWGPSGRFSSKISVLVSRH